MAAALLTSRVSIIQNKCKEFLGLGEVGGPLQAKIATKAFSSILSIYQRTVNRIHSEVKKTLKGLEKMVR